MTEHEAARRIVQLLARGHARRLAAEGTPKTTATDEKAAA